MTLHELVELCWIAAACNLQIGRAGFTRYRSGVRLAQSYSGLDKCLKYGLQIERGATDNFENVGGCSLLLEGFTQFVEQPRVLDGDDGLGGKILHQLDLLVGEWPHIHATD
jgi:hypothetical protein